jgi:hypothetical protein
MRIEIKTGAGVHRCVFHETPEDEKNTLFYRIDSILADIKAAYEGARAPVLFDLSGDCALLVVNPVIEDILTALGLNSMVEIYASEEEVPDSFKGS